MKRYIEECNNPSMSKGTDPVWVAEPGRKGSDPECEFNA